MTRESDEVFRRIRNRLEFLGYEPDELKLRQAVHKGMKVDLVMWTKNGEATLPLVLSRINKTVPKEAVANKFVVDDDSEDESRQIAERHGWNVVRNEGAGISDAANTALKLVDTEFFASFEQDLLLTRSWWRKIPCLLSGRVVVACGMRFASQPRGLMELQRYVALKYRGEKRLSSWLRTREMAAFTLGKTLDNTIYKTDALRSVGGFPKMETNAGVDSVLAYKLLQAGYGWAVNYDVQSTHLRCGLKDELEHQYWYGTQLKAIWREIRNVGVRPPVDRVSVFFRLLCSPLTAFFIAFKTREPSTVFIHPLVKLYYTRGLLETKNG